MKKNFLYSASIALMMACLVSCSDDEPEYSIPSATYTDSTGLTLNVNGVLMVGKTAQIDVDANNPSAAAITLSSTFNLADIPDVPAELGTTELAGPGVIPGSPVTVLNVALDYVESGEATFAGNDATDYCTFEYSGTVTETSIDINIANLKLKDLSLAGFYRLLPYKINDDWESDEYGTVYSEPVYVKWESSASLDFLGSPMPPANLVKLLMAMPLINDAVTIPDMLCTLLQDVRFGDDGNILANYADFNGNLEELEFRLSPANMAQYVVTAPGNMRFYLNPQAVMMAAGRADSAPIDININNLLGNVMAQLSPMLKDGVPMYYKVSGANTTIYLDTQLLKPLLQNSVVPLLSDENLVNQLVALVAADESLAMIAEALPSMIQSVVDVINGTTTLEIGLNLTTATN